jgi:CO/xanthine dehydrogenase FAD-binding subunit
MTRPIEYYRPTSRAEALELLARPGLQTAPFIIQPKPTALRQMGADALVDLSLLGLNYIQEMKDGSVHIGALVTLQEMVESPVLNVGMKTLLGHAATLAAGPGIRNLSGLWGALQARSGPPEVALALLVLSAQVVIMGAGENQRTLGLPEFYEKGSNSIQMSELMIEVILPVHETGRCWALERVARTPRDEAIVAASAVVEVKDGRATRVSLAVAGANPQPRRIPLVEDLLTGKTFNEIALKEAADTVQEQAEPLGDFRGSQDYRRSMAGLVARRALEKAWDQAAGRER